MQIASYRHLPNFRFREFALTLLLGIRAASDRRLMLGHGYDNTEVGLRPGTGTRGAQYYFNPSEQ